MATASQHMRVDLGRGPMRGCLADRQYSENPMRYSSRPGRHCQSHQRQFRLSPIRHSSLRSTWNTEYCHHYRLTSSRNRFAAPWTEAAARENVEEEEAICS